MYRAVKFPQMYASDGSALRALHADRATFLDIVSATDSAAELKKIATDMGLAYHKKSVRAVNKYHDYQMPATTRVIELVERETTRFGLRSDETSPIYLAWVKIPEVAGLPIRTVVSDDVSDAEIENFRLEGDYSQLGIGQYGDDENGKCVIAVGDHSFWAIGPLLGYSVNAVCAMLGGAEDNITFDDQVFYCQGCNTLQEDTDGHMYRYRQVDGELFGIACGCAAEAELECIEDYVNEPDKQITAESAERLVESGNLVHVARYIGGWTDPGRGGYYDGESVENGEPEGVIKALLEASPDASFVCSVDESGQFQTYWSVYRLIEDKAA